ncbi:hypothetical protein NCTGTJJY_CDS0068 [Serratia phage 92A1]|nr:hypothetical protein NCTGTJJY_CDS0068 [Serratia phage 92A1]
MIEIYYIPEEVRRCYSCVLAKKLAESTGLEVKLYPIMHLESNNLGFDYNRETIYELMERAGFTRSAIQYPQIFIDQVHIGSTGALQAYVEDVYGIF